MSRIFMNCKEAISEVRRDLFEMGVEVHPQSMQNKDVSKDEGYATKELQNYSFCILDTSDKNDITETLSWCNAEFSERVSGYLSPDGYTPKNPGEAWKLREEVWSEFLNTKGQFCYSYNERMCWQLATVIRELEKNPDTRQAIIEIHSRNIDQDGMGGNYRIPCSMYYQLMIRNGRLDIIYNMRSTDFFTHFKNDIWLAAELRDWIADKVGIKPGKYFMNAGSLHGYKKDFPEDIF